jgi:hypothetical protein
VEYPSGWWIEGVGSVLGPLNTWLFDASGSTRHFLRCEKNGQEIFNVADFDIRIQEPGRQMLSEGKSWLYDYVHYESDDETGSGGGYTRTVYPVSFTIKGDTVIASQHYSKLYRQIRDGVLTYDSAVREEGQSVYRVPNEQTAEELLLSFDPDIINKNMTDYDKITTVKSDSIIVNGRRFCRHRYGTEEWFEKSEIIGVEGIGFYRNGLVLGMNFERPTCICDYMEFKACNVNGECIFTANDFNVGPITNGITTIQTSPRTVSPLYDLQGRRQDTAPRKGIYIRGGKKRVAR